VFLTFKILILLTETDGDQQFPGTANDRHKGGNDQGLRQPDFQHGGQYLKLMVKSPLGNNKDDKQ